MADPLQRFLARSRRRAQAGILLEWSLLAAAAGLAGAIALLLVGARILSGYWLPVLFGGALGWGLIRAWREFPSPYEFAQQIDRRLKLNDTLSSAYYFCGHQASVGSRRFAEALCRQAGVLAGSLSPREAAPLRVPRQAYATGLLAAGALGLFAVRYAVIGSLDLRPPLLPSFDDFATGAQVAVLRTPVNPRQPGSAANAPGEFAPLDEPGFDASDLGANKPRESGAPRDTAASVATSSLFEKLLDKVEDAITRLTSQELPGNTAAKDRPAGAADQGGRGTPDPTPNTPVSPAATAGREQQAADSEKSGERSGRENGRDSGGNDHGDNEGDKSIREAAQLNAAGKIREQYLQRQARIKGDVMVEVAGSSEQTLVTPYSEVVVSHSAGGGRSQRNEIPLIYQHYVGRYYQELRHTARSGK